MNKERRIGFLAPAGPTARDLEKEYFISAALMLPGNVIGYHVSERLAALFPDKAIVETGDRDFNLADYARCGHCTLTYLTSPHGEHLVYWECDEREIRETMWNTWVRVAWQGQALDVLLLHWDDTMRYYILADTREAAERFFAAVCAWEEEVHGEILVFDGGRWSKDEELFTAIKSARFDTLVLRAGLAEDIVSDVTRFFATRETYDRFGVPWKRGILFAGPPGNGKTHTIKALVNGVDQPCLYVKSFRDAHGPDEYSMRAVFERARRMAPCILVLEDLDALVTSKNRSFFLNEMDGFAANRGILTLATTNHPEQLDPAIVQRPSRFDRTYRFDLPGIEERTTYIGRWNATLQPEMRLSADAIGCIAEATENFSFAYLKELFLSAMMRWLETPRPGEMDGVIVDQVCALREQMLSNAPGKAGQSRRR